MPWHKHMHYRGGRWDKDRKCVYQSNICISFACYIYLHVIYTHAVHITSSPTCGSPSSLVSRVWSDGSPKSINCSSSTAWHHHAHINKQEHYVSQHSRENTTSVTQHVTRCKEGLSGINCSSNTAWHNHKTSRIMSHVYIDRVTDTHIFWFIYRDTTHIWITPIIISHTRRFDISDVYAYTYISHTHTYKYINTHTYIYIPIHISPYMLWLPRVVWCVWWRWARPGRRTWPWRAPSAPPAWGCLVAAANRREAATHKKRHTKEQERGSVSQEVTQEKR